MKIYTPIHELEPKEVFHSKIKEYYLNLANQHIPPDLLNKLIDQICDLQYDNYWRF